MTIINGFGCPYLTIPKRRSPGRSAVPSARLNFASYIVSPTIWHPGLYLVAISESQFRNSTWREYRAIVIDFFNAQYSSREHSRTLTEPHSRLGRLSTCPIFSLSNSIPSPSRHVCFVVPSPAVSPEPPKPTARSVHLSPSSLVRHLSAAASDSPVHSPDQRPSLQCELSPAPASTLPATEDPC